MTDASTGEAHEEVDLVSSFHWASRSEIFSVLHVALVHSLAVHVAPFNSCSGVLAFPAGSLGEMEEQVLCEVAFLELPDEQWRGVTSALASPASALEFHEDGRMPFEPDLLQVIVEMVASGASMTLGFSASLRKLCRCRRPVPKPRVKEPPITAKRGQRQRPP